MKLILLFVYHRSIFNIFGLIFHLFVSDALSEEANEYSRQELWPYMDDTEQWPNPNELSNLVRFQLLFLL